MDKPRTFPSSSGKQEKLLQALTRGLEDVAHVEPQTTSFNPGTTTLERLLEFANEVDFAAFAWVGRQRQMRDESDPFGDKVMEELGGESLFELPCITASGALRLVHAKP